MRKFGLSRKEYAILKRLSTPSKIQDFLDLLPINFEKHGETYMSPRRVLREQKAHCIEGAVLAALALWLHGGKPLLMDFTTIPSDEDHVIAVYKQKGYWGAISKTNHAILRWRDPVYSSPRELAMSYFHEYFMFENGHKSLVSFSDPFDLRVLGTAWITEESDLDRVADALDDSPHHLAIPHETRRHVRRASPIELKAGSLREWKKSDPRT